MMDEEFDSLLKHAARDYHEPPTLDRAARDAMWANIEARDFRHTTRQWPVSPWLGIAAALVIGIGIGRFAISGHEMQQPAPPLVASANRVPVPALYQTPTSQYLNQTTALLAALPGEAHGGRADAQFVNRAQNLLLTTRLLLDSPAAQDARLHDLLSDLELVLAQVVRLPNDGSPADLDLINQALQQHDVLPRLRSVAANISAD